MASSHTGQTVGVTAMGAVAKPRLSLVLSALKTWQERVPLAAAESKIAPTAAAGCNKAGEEEDGSQACAVLPPELV
jgi:hypothetical protein